MGPLPKPGQILGTRPVTEVDVLDEVIDKIDQSLPLLHKIAEGTPSADKPSNRLSKAQFKRARAVFQDMKDHPILTDKGDDIRILDEKQTEVRVNGVVEHLNGNHP